MYVTGEEKIGLGDWRTRSGTGRRARGRSSREKNVLEESNCEGRRRSVLGNRNKFLHGVREYCFAREGGWGEQWLYGRVLGRIAVAHRCRIRRGGRRNRTISHSERRVTGPFSRVVSRLLRTSTLYNHVYPRQNFPLGRSVRIRRTGARSAGKRRQTVDKLYEIAWLNAALRFGCDPSVGLQSNYIEFDSRVIQRRSTCPV